MKTLGKTKIIRLPGREVYFKKVEAHYQGEPAPCIRWERMEKDMSGICRAYHDSKFKSQNSVQEHPKIYDTPIRPIPADFETDLLGPYAALEYAAGHEPMKSFSLR